MMVNKDDQNSLSGAAPLLADTERNDVDARTTTTTMFQQETIVADGTCKANSGGDKEPCKRRGQCQKNHQYPKRGNSAFILFSQYKYREVKSEIETKDYLEQLPQISKQVLEAWKKLTPTERVVWVAKADHERGKCEAEGGAISPWKVPSRCKRARGDPSAPQRPTSAFVHYAITRSSQVIRENPEEKNNLVILKILGVMWNAATEEERIPFIEKAEKIGHLRLRRND